MKPDSPTELRCFATDHKLTQFPTMTPWSGPSWEANSQWASQDVPPCLWNPKGHCHVQTSQSLVTSLSHMNLVHKFPPSFPNIHSNIILSSMPRSSEWFFLSGFQPKFCTHFSFHPCALHAPLISSYLTWSPYSYLVKCTSYEGSHYAVFSSLLPHPSS
jgi:hypothetical protein